jgi:hypothetical protein
MTQRTYRTIRRHANGALPTVETGDGEQRNEEDLMTTRAKVSQVAMLKELLLTRAFEADALLNVLEKKGIVTKAEVLEEARRLRESEVKLG